jgi:hypothetical protein
VHPFFRSMRGLFFPPRVVLYTECVFTCNDLRQRRLLLDSLAAAVIAIDGDDRVRERERERKVVRAGFSFLPTARRVPPLESHGADRE